ncbi:hypothetical protein CANCADRAFT_22510 [Tortispora caseinolytica NRRL Y-17796]|uniref:non-specific serine/threonine protein kinase n=1 Tax=Tortispora caseinolytica NRRL Y-17796 TaxID=767744 RepID=A0A1E4TI87_9ASCO|nr:hypothetical protein CANCADRAFT_22510 [Tortispora caseinolytica NRRL Y-17796]
MSSSDSTSELNTEDNLIGKTISTQKVGSSSEEIHLTTKKLIGRGAFSVVVLAEDDSSHLRAVKITQLKDIDESSRSRMKKAIFREIDILSELRTPGLTILLGYRNLDDSMVLVFPFASGGDLFELASNKYNLLTPLIIGRITAELATVVDFLHRSNVVHRDIKLENVLVSKSPEELESLASYTASELSQYPFPLIMLTDLGLARRIDPQDPLLSTRCGSEDYAAPELLMGRQYDGRQTDIWSIGVLLYALLERRLPFDPLPPEFTGGRVSKSKVAHRIARIEWSWVRLKYSDQQDHTWDDAKRIVESCLCRRDSRLKPADILNSEFCKNSLSVPLQYAEDI